MTDVQIEYRNAFRCLKWSKGLGKPSGKTQNWWHVIEHGTGTRPSAVNWNEMSPEPIILECLPVFLPVVIYQSFKLVSKKRPGMREIVV